MCSLSTFLKINFLEIYLIFFDEFVQEGGKKLLILNVSSFPRDPKCCVKEGRKGRRTWRTVRRQQNVFSQPWFGDNNTDFHVPCTPNPVMCFGLRETLDALVLWRVQKNVFLRRSRLVSCVRTPVHMNSFLFVRIHTSSWHVYTFLKQHGVSNDPETFSCLIHTCERVYTNPSGPH